jgi:hypothetical protein
MSAFEMLQKDIHFVCEAPVLIYQFSPGNFILESDVCIGAVLSQVQGGRALDVRLSEWCCSVTMVWVQIPSREEQKFDSSKI